jgi:2,3-dihydroxybenzoate decarboxylase
MVVSTFSIFYVLVHLRNFFLVTPLYYDQPEYDIFWQALTDLDVPLYLHPRIDVAPILNFQFAQAPFLIGSPQQFTVTLSNHILG